MKLVSLNVDQIQVFVIINEVSMKINAGVNVNNLLIKAVVIKDLFGILLIINVNVINHVILDNIQMIRILSAEKGQSINQCMNVMKTLMKMR